MSGCAIGAKWSTLYTEIPKAEATGNFELRPDAMVIKINHDPSGKVTGVVYADRDGNQHEQKARIVCVAGNAIETPRLLLLSASSMFPNGLANSSGQVGKNYMPHLTGAVYAVMPGEVNLHRGTQMAGIIKDEQYHKPEREFAAGYELETLPAFGLPGFAAYAKPGGWGRDYARDIEAYRNAAGLWIVGEDMPQEQNRVTLDSNVKDKYGLPVAHVHRVDHPNDTAMRKHAWKMATALYEAAGARKVYTRGPFSSTHNLGTCRQSANPRDGVCNKYGQTHDITNLFISDGSQFTTSAAENPTLTIVALAIRQADYIAEAMRKQNI
jgi:choline dehydrogenase-like flavoprotein